MAKPFRALIATAVLLAVVPQVQAQDLKTAVQTALTSNPEIKAQDANFKAFVHELLQQQGTYEPTVSLFGDLGKEYVDDPAGLSVADNARVKTTSQLGVILELPIYDGYERANRVYAASARVDRSSLELLDASETMALLVAEQYINVARQQRLLAVARDNLDRLREIQVQAETLVQGGRLPVSDLLRVESSIFAAMAAITDIQRALANAQAKFRTLVGQAPQGMLRIPSPVRPPASIETVVAASVQNSYRVKIADANVDIRGFEREIADAEFQPRLSFNAGAAYGHNLDGASGDENNAFVGLGLTWKLYGGTRKEQRRALSERRNEALYDRLSVIRDVEEMATIAWNTYQINGLRLEYLSKRIESNTLLVENYEQEFQLATRSLLDLLIAENGLYNARFEYVNTRAILAFAGYRALAAQSKLAGHFGVKDSETFLAQIIDADPGDRPLEVVRKGRPLVDR